MSRSLNSEAFEAAHRSPQWVVVLSSPQSPDGAMAGDHALLEAVEFRFQPSRVEMLCMAALDGIAGPVSKRIAHYLRALYIIGRCFLDKTINRRTRYSAWRRSDARSLLPAGLSHCKQTCPTPRCRHLRSLCALVLRCLRGVGHPCYFWPGCFGGTRGCAWRLL